MWEAPSSIRSISVRRRVGPTPRHDRYVATGKQQRGPLTNDSKRAGRIGRHFTDAEKYDLIEYLKSATYADYPRTVLQHPDPGPCVDASTYDSKY